jgi:hypothetical protein
LGDLCQRVLDGRADRRHSNMYRPCRERQ